jgi:D-aminopeptidase
VRVGILLFSFVAVFAITSHAAESQLKRIARRASMGIARTGSVASNSSGDIFVAFSTANAGSGGNEGVPTVRLLPNERITPFFEATVDATEEAIINALVAAESMTGANDRRALALPHDQLVRLLRKYTAWKTRVREANRGRAND